MGRRRWPEPSVEANDKGLLAEWTRTASVFWQAVDLSIFLCPLWNSTGVDLIRLSLLTFVPAVATTTDTNAGGQLRPRMKISNLVPIWRVEMKRGLVIGFQLLSLRETSSQSYVADLTNSTGGVGWRYLGPKYLNSPDSQHGWRAVRMAREFARLFG
ncbi:hypothetical protein IE4872_PA00092 (plasmid) [Rhizobium gallicum]|uniref:Uncharacterized protein n=1 Tax=Rhizobium gallicum TaxID=56730 RepID=A0A1L5NPM2_9HYPH|nr:hypothetical protein IE4872_PA00092 [Rhizobium gallicum]